MSMCAAPLKKKRRYNDITIYKIASLEAVWTDHGFISDLSVALNLSPELEPWDACVTRVVDQVPVALSFGRHVIPHI